MERRFVQIQYTGHERYVAVADDGTAWEFRRRDYAWAQLPKLPPRDDDRLDALQRSPIKPQFPLPRKTREDFLP